MGIPSSTVGGWRGKLTGIGKVIVIVQPREDVKVKIKIYLFRVQISMWLHMFFRLYLSWQWAHSSLQLLIQPWICAQGTHYGWVDQGNVEYKVYPTLLHMASTGNQTREVQTWVPCPIHLATCSHKDVYCGWLEWLGLAKVVSYIYIVIFATIMFFFVFFFSVVQVMERK